MKQKLLLTLAVVFALANVTASAQEVTLDFTTNSWGLPEGSSNKATDSASFTSGDYTITLAASNGYYYNTDGYLMLGKSGSTLTLPAFSFNVSKIEIVGNDGASASVTQNIYVGETAVSTETKGATGTNTYEIAEANQAAGNIYVLKVTSKHNTQITKINIYKKSGDTKKSAGLTFSETSIQVEQGTEFTAPTFTKATTADVTFTSDNTDVATVSSDGTIALAGGLGTAVVTAFSEENDEYEAGSATCTVQVYKNNVYKKVTTVTSGKDYLLVAQRNDSTMYAYPLSETKTYGYLSAGVINSNTDEIKVKSLYDDDFTITAVDDGYTIMDCYDRYLYQSGTYKSFNVGTDAKSWTIEPQDDGTFKISMNGYFIQWGQTTYKTFGVYTEMQDNAVLPMLYQLEETPTAITAVEQNKTADDSATYNLAGQRVGKSYKGIVVKNGKKYVQK